MLANMIARGSLLTAPERLTIASYNLLAPIYVRPIDERTGTVQGFAAFEWASAEDLDWERRRPRLLAELEASKADVICLQEVQFERIPGKADDDEDEYVLPSYLRLDNYECILPDKRPLREMALRNERVLRVRAPVGNALLYRTDRLEAADVPLSPRGSKKVEQQTGRVSACVVGKAGGGLDALGRLALFSLHLDATSEDKRVKALSRCLECARQSYGTRNVLLGGDLNAELQLGSCVHAMVEGSAGVEEPSEADLERECATALRIGAAAEEEEAPMDVSAEGGGSSSAAAAAEDAAAASGKPSSEQMAAWRELYTLAKAAPLQQRIALSRVPTGLTRAAFAHGTTSGPCVGWRLDHILFTSRCLELHTYHASLDSHPELLAAGTPNPSCPSDHIMVAASFDLREPPVIEEAAREALLKRVNGMLDQQAVARDELAAVVAGEVSALEATEKAAAGGAADEPAAEADVPQGKKKKNKKQKAGPPSAAMQALLRSKREREKELKASQLAAREELVKGLSEVEKDAIEAAAIDLT